MSDVPRTRVGLKGDPVCDAPGCQFLSDWGVGLEIGEDSVWGHTACNEHLVDAILVTLAQLRKRDLSIKPSVIVTLLEIK